MVVVGYIFRGNLLKLLIVLLLLEVSGIPSVIILYELLWTIIICDTAICDKEIFFLPQYNVGKPILV